MTNSNCIEFSESVKLLGIEIHNHVNFETHASTIFKKAAV